MILIMMRMRIVQGNDDDNGDDGGLIHHHCNNSNSNHHHDDTDITAVSRSGHFLVRISIITNVIIIIILFLFRLVVGLVYDGIAGRYLGRSACAS